MKRFPVLKRLDRQKVANNVAYALCMVGMLAAVPLSTLLVNRFSEPFEHNFALINPFLVIGICAGIVAFLQINAFLEGRPMRPFVLAAAVVITFFSLFTLLGAQTMWQYGSIPPGSTGGTMLGLNLDVSASQVVAAVVAILFCVLLAAAVPWVGVPLLIVLLLGIGAQIFGS